MDTWDIFFRLGAAAMVGAALGLNRDLHGKPTGVRTLGLVGLGAALAVLSVSEGGIADASRVIQGIVTGIGFVGAGVIIREGAGHKIHGLTTAASVWLTACVGAACAAAQWRVIFIGMPLVFLILLFGGSFEKAVHRRWPHEDKGDGSG
jgi:putative Mg2+ transporter-C (MgtC) family protein